MGLDPVTWRQVPWNIVSPKLLPFHICKSEQSRQEITLKEMFRGVNNVDVAEILKSSASLEEATNRILDCSYAEDILNERRILQNFIFSTIFLYWARVIKWPLNKSSGSSESPMLTMSLDLRYYKFWHYYMIYVKSIDNTSRVHNIFRYFVLSQMPFWIPPVNAK